MPRNSSGTYSLPAGNPVVTGTTISTTWANTTLSDIATALTDSLSRSGDGGMTAPLELASGAIGAPGLSWSAETTSGLYRAGAGDFRFSISATDRLTLTASGLTVNGTISASNYTGFANPSATIGLSANNGSATTAMRSDASPALSQSITPTWTGTHTFSPASGRAFTANGNANQYVTVLNGNSTSGQSFGLGVRAGTTGADVAIDVLNQAGSRNFLTILGSGATTFGNATDNPTYSFLGTGAITSGGVLLGPDGSVGSPVYSFSGDTDTGAYHRLANTVSFAGGGTLSADISAAGLDVISGVVVAPVGSAAAPSFGFRTDPDTGIYNVGANSLGISAGGGNVATLSSSGITFVGTTTHSGGATPQTSVYDSTAASGTYTTYARSGTALADIGNAAQCFSGGVLDNFGLNTRGARSMDFGTNSTFRVRLDNNAGEFLFVDGSASRPGVSFVNDTDTGFYRVGANSLGISAGGSNIFTVSSSGISISAGAIVSGTYTPTLTNTTNISSSTSAVCQYIRVGAVVTVSGVFSVTPTAGGGTVLEISFPIASNITAETQCGGAGMHNSSSVGISGSIANDRAFASWTAASASADLFRFTFTYLIN